MIYRNATAVPRAELTDFVTESPTADDMFIGALLLPASPLRLPAGHFPKITIAEGDLMRAAQNKRAPGAGFVRSQAGIVDGNVALVQYGEELSIPDENQMLYEDYFSLEKTYTNEGRNRLLRLQEILVQTEIQNPATFQVVNAGLPYIVGNKATNTFVEDMQGIFRLLKTRGQKANTIMIPGPVYDRVRVGTPTKEYIAGVTAPGSVVTVNTLQKAFAEYGIEQVLIGDSYVNQSINNDDSVINPIWDPRWIFVGNVQSGPQEKGGVGRDWFWEKEGPILNVSTYRDEPKKSNIIRVMTTQQPAITNARAGILVATGYV